MKSVGCISKASSYLIRPHHTFCFRLGVPPDLQPIIGKKKLRYSMKTCNRGEDLYLELKGGYAFWMGNGDGCGSGLGFFDFRNFLRQVLSFLTRAQTFGLSISLQLRWLYRGHSGCCSDIISPMA